MAQDMKSSTIAAQLAAGIVTSHPEKEVLSQQVGKRLITDVLGICIAARHEFYVKAALSSFEQEGQWLIVLLQSKALFLAYTYFLFYLNQLLQIMHL